MVKVIWSKNAKADLYSIYNYISRDSTYYSLKTINKIVKITTNLTLMPYMERKVLEYNNKNIREIIFKQYRIIYEIRSNFIIIQRVWHAARLLLI